MLAFRILVSVIIPRFYSALEYLRRNFYTRQRRQRLLRVSPDNDKISDGAICQTQSGRFILAGAACSPESEKKFNRAAAARFSYGWVVTSTGGNFVLPTSAAN